MSSVLGSKNTKSILEVKVNLVINTMMGTIEKRAVNYRNNQYLSIPLTLNIL